MTSGAVLLVACLYKNETFDLSRRYTSQLIGKARHVTAVDFMENFVEKNKEENSHLGNAEFIQADVTQLEFPEKRWERE